jgi:hypothetical protein
MPNQPKTLARSVRVGDDLWNAAKVQAKERHETVTDVVVRALKRYAKPTETPWDDDALRLAISDPGATTQRLPNEHVTDWTARAVLAAAGIERRP